MTQREKTTLAFELALATALAFVVGGILHESAGLPLSFAVPSGELTWGAVILYFIS